MFEPSLESAVTFSKDETNGENSNESAFVGVNIVPTTAPPIFFLTCLSI